MGEDVSPDDETTENVAKWINDNPKYQQGTSAAKYSFGDITDNILEGNGL